jgi:hypothetical protein
LEASSEAKKKNKGGLAVINLTLQNDALLIKQLGKFFNKKNIQWVKLIWKHYPHGVPHLRREKGSSGGRTSFIYTVITEEFVHVLLLKVILSVYGMI